METTEKKNPDLKQDKNEATVDGDEAKPDEEQLVEENSQSLDAEVARGKAASNINRPGTDSPGKYSPNSERKMDEPEHKDTSSNVLASPTKAEIAKDQDKNSCPNFTVSKYHTLLSDLNLNLDSKLTLQKARTVDKTTLNDDQLTSPDQIPHYILKKLMIANYHAREFTIESETWDRDKINNSDTDDDDSEDEGREDINPLDALLAIFHCSDDFLRQDLAIKLSACQLSVPFLLPDPEAPTENVTILLSALDSITKTWKTTLNDDESAQQVFATEYPFPVVSFIRIDKITMSKSHLINKVMSGASGGHNFFHKDMNGGDVDRKIVDGLVELSWYLPGGSEKQKLKREICFANLRGDAKDFEKQTNFLLTISSVICLLLPSSFPDETLRKTVDKILDYKAKVILIFNEIGKFTKDHFDHIKKKYSNKLSIISKSKNANEHSFLEKIRQTIQGYIEEVEPKPLVELESYAMDDGIHLDGGQTHLTSIMTVDAWLKMGTTVAKELLTVQTHVPKLANLKREKHCGKRDMNEIYEDIEEEKKAQKQLNEKVFQCLNTIAVMGKTERNHALAKLKLQLDKMSLQKMTELHQEYSAALQTREDNANAKSSQRNHLKDLEKSITKCSFGLEQVIRELAQLYEPKNNITKNYARAAADMLLSGYSLELLDGDSSYIRLKWFNAVYRVLKDKTNDAKIFVISVLGIQSSGKSTLLNTMFGLQFPVSAGRCTRGAFVSLIPVSGSLESNVNFILIIDTEGLRGSDDPVLREHDNELATFAIGVADLAIINILGENNTVIQEFLAIAVHAFLKMRLVEKKKGCKFVHQNIVDTDATKKLHVNRSELKNNLDKMVRLAAAQENCENSFRELNDIIQFSETEDVYYMPSLFQGDPPMAPVNPGYGRAVQKVKEDIISWMCSSKSFRLSVSQFQERVKNLWKVILKENFIFSFRNSIEIRAKTSLDKKFFKEYVTLMVRGMGKLEREIEVALRNCKSDELKKTWKEKKAQIDVKGEELSDAMKEKMRKFFEKSEDKATMEQWKQHVMNKIDHHKEKQVRKVEENCRATFSYLQKRKGFDEKKKEYKKELLVKAREFITSGYNTRNVEKREKEFEQQWKLWIEDVPNTQETRIDVNNEMKDVLCSADPHLTKLMREKLADKGYVISRFQDIATVIDDNKLAFKNHQEHTNHIYKLLRRTQSAPSRHSIEKVCEESVKTALDFVNMKSSSQDARCKRDDLEEMYHKVITTIKGEANKHGFKLQDLSLKCDILLYVFAKAYKNFDEMEKRYLEERDIRGDLERSVRLELEEYFLQYCSDMEKEALIATLIARHLHKPIESELNRNMGAAVADKLMKLNKYKSKGQLHASALIQLGEEGEFESYTPYLRNPLTFLENFLVESIENDCLNTNTSLENDCENTNTPLATTILKNQAKEIEDKVFAAMSIAYKELRESGSKKITTWIEKFVESGSALGITKEMFPLAAIHDDLTGVDVFQCKVRENVTEFLKSLVNRRVDRATMLKWKPSPLDQLFTEMFGCQSVCPFCKGLCDQTMEHCTDQLKHSTRIHRPQGVSGYRNSESLRLSTGICTQLVDSKYRFRNPETLNKWHSYKKYEKVNKHFKSWSIPPDSTFEASKYWQWFMATFAKELAEYYNAQEPIIPETWKKRSFIEVADQLRQEYKL